LDHHDEIYRKAEGIVRPILESNAKRFARQLDMTYPEALQEARYGLVLALRRYDYNASKGGIFNFVKVAVRRHFLKLWAEYRTQARRPHVQVTSEDGKRMSLPVPFVEHRVEGRGVIFSDGGVGGHRMTGDFMDSFESALLELPDATLIESEACTTTSAFQVALENALSERDREVLRCKHDPPRGLVMLMLDDLATEPTIPLIGRYLGLSKNEVDWALRRIREAALSLIGRDFSELTDLSVVRAYVERRP
jgi:hypothetical protein